MTDAIRILVIDDSEDDRELYRRALQKSVSQRYDVSDAENGDGWADSITRCLLRSMCAPFCRA